MASESINCLDVCAIGFWFLKKRRLRNLSLFVFLSGPGTVRYSHDLMAKKNAPVHRSAIATAHAVVFTRNNRFRMQPGSAFCGRGAGSSFL